MDAVPPHLSALPYVAVHKCEKENSDNKWGFFLRRIVHER